MMKRSREEAIMKILLCGGGTGGHVTPLLAIAHDLKLKDADCKIIYVDEHGGKFSDLAKKSDVIDELHYIYAGKFRRYHNQSWLIRITDLKTIFFNVRDLFYFLIGLVQSVFLLKKLKPDVVFSKGSYVGLPVGFAARLWKIPIVTHDSDAIPTLTNKVIGKWAVFNAVGIENGTYPYSKDKIRYVGIPLASGYEYVTDELKHLYREQIGLPPEARMMFITGGSLGAVTINRVVAEVAEELLVKFPDFYIYHQVGRNKLGVYDGLPENDHLKKFEFIDDMYKYYGAADIVVARAGATTISELAMQAKASIIIPNPLLTGGHQTKNAAILSNSDSAVVLQESDLLKDKQQLYYAVSNLLSDDTKQKRLSQNIHKLASPNAASDIASLLLSVVKGT